MKYKSYKKYKPSGVEWLGEIPEEWEVKRLKNIGNSLIGITYSPNDTIEENENSILVLRSSNIQNGKPNFNDNVYVNFKPTERYITRIGDILLCSRNGSRNLIGKNILINSDLSGVTFGAFMTIYRTKYYNYIYYIFNSQIFISQSSLFLTSTINQLTIETINNLTIPLPPLSEQKAIADFLDRETAKIDSLIEKAKLSIELSKEKRQALISSAVTGKIDVRGV